MAGHGTKLGANGRVVIPAPVRREAGLSEGDRLVARNEGGRIVLESRDVLIDRMQEEFKGLRAQGSQVDQLIEERRRAAAAEEQEIERWTAAKRS